MTSDASVTSPVYRRADGLVVQRALELSPWSDVPSAVRRPQPPLAPDDVAIAVARKGAVTTLNLLAAFVWDCLDGRRGLDEIAAEITSRFRVDSERARVDVGRLIEQLAARRLVVAVPTTTCDGVEPCAK